MKPGWITKTRTRIRERVAAPRQRQLLSTIGTVLFALVAGLLLFVATREA